MKKYLVTGGAGFIGSHIVEELIRRKGSVVVLDNFSSGKREHLESVLDKIELVEGDIRDSAVLRKIMKGAEIVIHEAALRSVPASVEDPVSYNDVNVAGTLNVFLAAAEAGVKRVVFASSSSVYGDIDTFPTPEDTPKDPLSPYAATKLTGELYARLFSRLYGLEVVCLRYFNVFGPRQDPASQYAMAVPKFIISTLNDEPCPIFGDGLQSRDFTYIDNVAAATLLAATAPEAAGEAFNIAGGADQKVVEVARAVNKILNKDIPPKYLPPRKGDPCRTLADIRKAKKLFNWTPHIDFEEGLRLTVAWFRHNS